MSQQTLLNHLEKTLARTEARVVELKAMIAGVKAIPTDTKTLDLLNTVQASKSK